jgi:nitrate reductase gamma subunit
VAPWVWWTLLIGAVLLVAWGWFVLGFLTEPSAVGRMRSGLIVIGGVSIALGVIAAVAGVWMLLARRT